MKSQRHRGTSFACLLGKKNQEWIKDHHLKSLKYFVGLDGSAVCGTTGVYEFQENWKTVSWLGWLCVDPMLRRKGLGTQLLNLIESIAKTDGKEFIRLYTDKEETVAHRLYKKTDSLEKEK